MSWTETNIPVALQVQCSIECQAKTGLYGKYFE